MEQVNGLIGKSNQKENFYFCYGSNLLSSRMKINNPTAQKFGPGRLKNWKLGISGMSIFWMGASADIIPSPGDEVLGMIWTIDEFEPLDRQEAGYRPIQVNVEMLDTHEVISCRTYVQVEDYKKKGCVTSLAYKNVIIAGCRESGLPDDYAEKVRKLPDNGVIPDRVAGLVPESQTG